jgi:hypothetical protein
MHRAVDTIGAVISAAVKRTPGVEIARLKR